MLTTTMANNNNNNGTTTTPATNSQPAATINLRSWVKDKMGAMGAGSLFNSSGTGNNQHHQHNRFSRNDSDQSNSSGSANSAPVTCQNTPTGTPIKAANQRPTGGAIAANLSYSNRQNSFPAPRQKKFPFTGGSLTGSNNSSIKLSAKSNSTTSVANGGSVSGQTASGSLRRRRFKQQYQQRLERRLSRQTSSGTSISTSQEYSSSGTSICANPIVDRLLDYIRDNYAKQMEPFAFKIEKKFRLTSFASFRMESGNLHGTSNFERIGDSRLIKSSDEFAQIILASNILFSDLLVEFTYSARIARFLMRNKQLRIFIEKCIMYVEIAIDHTMSTRIKMLRLISMDGVETRTRGIPFPLNKSFDAYALKTVHTMAANSEQYTDQIVYMVNQFCDNWLENALRSLSLLDMFW